MAETDLSGLVEPIKGGQIKKGMYALLKGKPCRVYTTTTLYIQFSRSIVFLFLRRESMVMLNVTSSEPIFSRGKKSKVWNPLPIT